MHLINIYNCLLFSKLFLVYGKSRKPLLLIEKTSFDGPDLKFVHNTKSGDIEQYLYNYKYSMDDIDVVSFRCVAHSTLKDPVLQWKIDSKELATGTNCTEEHVQTLNYISKFGKNHNGNILTCYLKSPKIALALVSLVCFDCDRADDYKLSADCFHYNASSIGVYVNGAFSSQLDRVVIFKNNDVLTIYCRIMVDDEHVVEFNTSTIEKYSTKVISNSVTMLKINASDLLDDKTLACKKSNYIKRTVIVEARIHFKETSALYIKITSSRYNSSKVSYRQFTELPFKVNDTVKLTCVCNSPFDVALWLYKNGLQLNHTKKGNKITYETTLTLEDANTVIDCQLRTANTAHDKHTIVFTYINDTDVNTLVTNDSLGGNSTDSTIYPIAFPIWIIAAIAIVVILVAITVVALCYKLWPKATTSLLQNEITYINFQNMYTLPEHPQEEEYSRPVDNLHISAHATGQSIQETYSTPFVPTIEEMYTKPEPKKLKLRLEPVYQLPGKMTYANLTTQKNQTDPGYSNVSRDDGDAASETYTYCTPGGYAQPR